MGDFDSTRIDSARLEIQDAVKDIASSVLVVDDSKLNRQLLSDLLRGAGHRVTTERNGKDALELLSRRVFDLILLDILLPEMDGYEVLEAIMADPQLRLIPVIMITGVDEIKSAARCIELGAEDYILKPFNSVLLRARIGASLEKKLLRERERAYLNRLDEENRRKSMELEDARELQMSMLPENPPRPGWIEIAAHQITASEVGGDYYDFRPLADDAWLCAVGDAAGHGVGAGLMVAMTKALFLTMPYEEEKNGPQNMLTRMNAVMNNIGLRDSRSNMALNLMELRPSAAGVSVIASGCGMPPVYIIREDGRVESTMMSGLPLGMIHRPDMEYEPFQYELARGDVMLLVSDGLPELMNPEDEMLEYSRLAELIARLNTAGTASEILTGVVEIGSSWARGVPNRDDMTMVVFKAI